MEAPASRPEIRFRPEPNGDILILVDGEPAATLPAKRDDPIVRENPRPPIVMYVMAGDEVLDRLELAESAPEESHQADEELLEALDGHPDADRIGIEVQQGEAVPLFDLAEVIDEAHKRDVSVELRLAR